MSLNRNKLYIFLLLACSIGYVWLFYSTTKLQLSQSSFEVCIIKHLTNIPCPSCGSTRSVQSLMSGNFFQSLYINPMGLIISCIMIVTPIWILMDVTTRGNTLLRFYERTEYFLKKPMVAIPLILIVLLNWIWNIIKGL